MRKFSIFLAFLVLVGCQTGYALNETDAEVWTVVEWRTEPPRPIPEAYVLARYVGSEGSMGHSSIVCDNAVLLRSNKDGQVRVPSMRGRLPEFYTYKAGWTVPIGPDRSRHELTLTPASSVGQQIETYKFMSTASICPQLGTRGLPISEFFDILVIDLQKLPESEDRARLISYMTRMSRLTKEVSK